MNGQVITKCLDAAFGGAGFFRDGGDVGGAVGDGGENVQFDGGAQRDGLLVSVQGIENALRVSDERSWMAWPWFRLLMLSRKVLVIRIAV